MGFSVQTNVDKDQVKAAIKAQQDQQIDNASALNVLQYGFYVHLTYCINGFPALPYLSFMTGTFS